MQHADTLGRLMGTIGRPSFEGAFFELARNMLDVSSCSVFSFEEERRPVPVILEGHGSDRRTRTKMMGNEYAASGFRSDPQLPDLFDISDTQVRLTNPADISDVTFRSRFYGDARIAHEITILAKHNRKHFYVGLYRGIGQPQFARGIVEEAQQFARITLPAVNRHIELLMADPDQDELSDMPAAPTKEMLAHLTAVLLAEGNSLSPREAEVCAAIILGYRTLAISINLGISENTICTHRKRAYAKLGISSQNELFSRYFRIVTRLKKPNMAARSQPMMEPALYA